MFLALQMGDKDAADHFRELMEGIRRESILARKLPVFDHLQMPDFLNLVLNKNQFDLNLLLRSNCINAAFNFHSDHPIYEPYTTMDFLKQIRADFCQLSSREELQIGDLVVFWSSAIDQKDREPLKVVNLDPQAVGFPFGYVFDHVAVYLGQDCLFHKPNPTLISRYQINHWDDVVGFSEVVSGFEMTFHTKDKKYL